MITIRNYSVEDAKALWDIHFYTIRNINIRDYSQAQVEAWAPERLDPSVWEKRMKGLSPFVAEIDGVIVGYTDLQASGLIDHFFCHHEHQGKGVGKALMNHVFKVGNSRGIKRYFLKSVSLLVHFTNTSVLKSFKPKKWKSVVKN
ncbi:acetyltransferase family protein [Vibrio parahaemolyticus VPCR-2009]|nr:acetyltransferase family protein [Vibrio parahaemolyticus VPCR-2009]